MIHHIVLVKLQSGVTREDPRVTEGLADLIALRDQVEGIQRWEHGWNVADSPVSWDFALDCTFASRAALEAYGRHPAHRAVIGRLRELVNWAVCDFEG